MRINSASAGWSRPPLIHNQWLRLSLYLGFFLYLIAAVSTLDVNWLRVLDGLSNGQRVLEGFFVGEYQVLAVVTFVDPLGLVDCDCNSFRRQVVACGIYSYHHQHTYQE